MGLYSQVLLGFSQGLVGRASEANLQMQEFASYGGSRNFQAIPAGVSAANFRWYPTEFSALRFNNNTIFWSRTSFSPIAKSIPFFCQFESSTARTGATQVLKHAQSRTKRCNPESENFHGAKDLNR